MPWWEGAWSDLDVLIMDIPGSLLFQAQSDTSYGFSRSNFDILTCKKTSTERWWPEGVFTRDEKCIVIKITKHLSRPLYVFTYMYKIKSLQLSVHLKLLNYSVDFIAVFSIRGSDFRGRTLYISYMHILAEKIQEFKDIWSVRSWTGVKYSINT